MRTNEMQKMYAHILRGWTILFPHICFFGGEPLPQRIDELESDRNVADQFTKLVVAHNETGFGELVFPKLTRVVKENARDQKIKVQLGIERRDGPGYAHHLRGVLDETPAPSMMIFASCCGATKSVAPFVDERFGQCAKTGINDRANGLHDKFPVRCLLCAQVCRSFQ